MQIGCHRSSLTICRLGVQYGPYALLAWIEYISSESDSASARPIASSLKAIVQSKPKATVYKMRGSQVHAITPQLLRPFATNVGDGLNGMCPYLRQPV